MPSWSYSDAERRARWRRATCYPGRISRPVCYRMVAFAPLGLNRRCSAAQRSAERMQLTPSRGTVGRRNRAVRNCVPPHLCGWISSQKDLAAADQRPHTFVGEYFQQQGMLDTTVDNMHAAYTAARCVECRGDLRQ